MVILKKVEKPSDVESAIKDALKINDKCVFIDFITDQMKTFIL